MTRAEVERLTKYSDATIDSLRKQLEEADAEVERLREDNIEQNDLIGKQAVELKRLRAENEALEARHRESVELLRTRRGVWGELDEARARLHRLEEAERSALDSTERGRNYEDCVYCESASRALRAALEEKA